MWKLSIGNLWAVLKLVILTVVSSTEFFRCTVLDYLSLIFPCIYSLSLECSKYTASTSKSTDISASEDACDDDQ